MKIVKIPTESIQLKDKVVPKHVVIFQDKVVHTGTKAQCHRFVFYMEGASDEMILSRLDLSK
jgi:hypothetical protein|tara:strand:+ start:834 stop:1019 length:186 start_codon:yes stop_codon:yes gene_type:complete